MRDDLILLRNKYLAKKDVLLERSKFTGGEKDLADIKRDIGYADQIIEKLNELIGD